MKYVRIKGRVPNKPYKELLINLDQVTSIRHDQSDLYEIVFENYIVGVYGKDIEPVFAAIGMNL